MATHSKDGRGATQRAMAMGETGRGIARTQFVGGVAAAGLLARTPGVLAKPAPLKFVTYGSAAKLMPPEVMATRPTRRAMLGKYLRKDFQWWGENMNGVVVRFQQFIAA